MGLFSAYPLKRWCSEGLPLKIEDVNSNYPLVDSMSGEPTLSPDGKWMWNGSEWIPAPPTHEPPVAASPSTPMPAPMPAPMPPINTISAPSKSISKEIKQRAFLRRCFVFLIILSGVLTAAQIMVSDHTGSWFLGAILGWIMLKLFPSKNPRGDAANFIEKLLWKIV